MRQTTRLLCGSVAVLLMAVTACGQPADKPADTKNESAAAAPSTPAGPATMQAEFAEPKPDHVLQIGVQSATRTGDRIEVVLDGTYGGNRTTQWDLTTVEATTDAGACQTAADPGFPKGSSRPGSVVTGTWTLTCPGNGPVQLKVDPFSGLLDSDSSFRITLR